MMSFSHRISAKKMSDLAYFQSLTQELQALKNRVRHYIKDAHWLSDGLWKESVLRSVLKRHLPKSLEVGTGFIVKDGEVSTQIDILIYDTTKPILFQDGDFVVVTPDLVKAIIEVKTRLRKADLATELNKLAENHHFAASTALCRPFVGLFSYDTVGIYHNDVQTSLEQASEGHPRRVVHCVSLGDDLFTRYWECPPETPRQPRNLWRSYHLESIAPAYFIHNIIESLCPESVVNNDTMWYPQEGKEAHTLGELEFTRA